MQEVLSRWGAWSANEGNSIDYRQRKDLLKDVYRLIT
ncbi:hypothetical protein [Proteus terrae]